MAILDSAQKKRLRAAAHNLKPVVMVGNQGYTEAIGKAIDEALTTHELIKVRLRGIESEHRQTTIDAICAEFGAQQIALIGAIVVLYRENPEN
ncbi:MAG: YhbY family RNA-binding protein [Gammaproteobacteria bacterium]